MAFRLQSFIAEAARVGTKKINAFDEGLAEELKNTASNLAKEAKEVRKERMTAVRDYRGKARDLRDTYGLNDGQIQTVLQNGVEGYQSIVDSVRSGAVSAKINNTEFMPRAFVQDTLFTPNAQTGAKTDYMSIDDQAAAYGSNVAPNTLDLEGTSKAVAASTRRGIFGIDADAVKSALGDVGADLTYSGPGFGPSQYQYNPPSLSAEDAQAVQLAESQRESLEAATDLSGERAAYIKAQAADIPLSAKVREERLIIDQDANARLEGMAELEKTKITAQIAAIREGINEGRLNRDVLTEKLKILQETGMDSATLGNDLIAAQIREAGKVKDVEELVYSTVGLRDTEQAKLLDMRNSGDFTTDQMAAQAAIVSGYDAMVVKNIKLLGNSISDDIFSKINLDTTFEKKLKTAALAANIGMEFSGLDDAIANISKGKLPQYLTSFYNVNENMSQSFGSYPQGENFIKGKMVDFNTAVQNYADTTKFGGPKGPKDLGKLDMSGIPAGVRPDKTDTASWDILTDKFKEAKVNANIGDIVRVPLASGNERVYILGSRREWLGY
tara:strand:- start:82 stop:1749 length:1668 start_codon:yes stop_codon:yes gene_type:complete